MHVYKGMSKLLGRDSVSSPHSLCRENREMRKCENAKMRKCENAKMRKCVNAKMRKCENAKMRKCENVKKKGIVTLAVIGKFAVTFGSHVGGEEETPREEKETSGCQADPFPNARGGNMEWYNDDLITI